jgi:GNAT superfamily N-acetyltransferase
MRAQAGGGEHEEAEMQWERRLIPAHYHFLSLWPGYTSHEVAGARVIADRLLPGSYRNHASFVNAEPRVPAAAIEGAATVLGAMGRPTTFHLEPHGPAAGMAARLAAVGYARTMAEAWMVHDGTARAVRSAKGATVRVVRPGDEDSIRGYGALYATSFELRPEVHGAFDAAFRGVVGSEVAIHYVAWVEDVAAGCMSLFAREGLGCVYNVSTLPRMRGRGIATMLLGRLIEDAIRLGNQTLFLQTRYQGLAQPLYERLGFRMAFVRDWWGRDTGRV